MKTKLISARTYALLNLIALVGICPIATSPPVCAESTVYNTMLGETNVTTPEISTVQLEKIIADSSAPVLDVRFAQEYAIAHIPGSINIPEKEVESITQRFPDKATLIVLYCNGPFCGKSKRVSAELVKRGYTNVKRYQLGIPIWRALGHTVQTDLAGFQYVFGPDAGDPKDARKVAEEIAKKAYWNSSYFGGTADELEAKGLWQQKKPK